MTDARSIARYCSSLRNRYEGFWGSSPEVLRLDRGPVRELPPEFHILRFQPKARGDTWIYVTCGMSDASFEAPLELHLFSPSEYEGHVELLTAVAHFHRTGARLGLEHTVDFGRGWFAGSECSCGLVSLPYIDGPELERPQAPPLAAARCLWLIPITERERAFKRKHGLETLEQEFERTKFNYLDAARPSVVS